MQARYQRLFRYSLGSITPDGFLREQMERNKDGMGGHLDELEPGMIADPFIHKSYVERWGNGDQSGWGAEISGNYWTGLIENAFTMQDKDLIEKVTNWVNTMLKKQKADGYLGTYYEEDAKIHEDYNAWGTACMLRGLLAFHDATGRTDVLEAVHRCLLWFCDKWAGDRKTSYAGGFIMEPMIFCYHLTGDQRLLDFAEEYAEYLCEHDIFSISYRTFLEKELQYNSEHTAGMGTNARLPALLYTATGKEKYLKASEKVLDEIYRKATQLSGSPVSVFEYLAPVSAIAETEYCSYAFYNATYSYMSCITGDSRFAERMEEMFYNGTQGARKKDERAIAYLSAPNQVYATDTSSSTAGNMQVYAPCYPVSCCPVNSVAVLGEFVRGMMLHDAQDNLYLVVYGPCTLKTDSKRLRMVTQYPFRNSVSVEIDEDSGEFTLFYRIPAWCKAHSVAVNGEKAESSVMDNGYAGVRRVWKKGDTLTLVFEMAVEVMRVDDSAASGKFPMAIKRGPLLYALPIPEKWDAYPGNPCTPLPEGWSWFRVTPIYQEADDPDPHNRIGLRRNQISWNVALDEKLSPENILVEEINPTGYVWEKPPIRLKVPAYKAPYLFATYPSRTFEPFGAKQPVTDKLELTLVPYGCTALRITYFPLADLEKK